MSPYYDRQIKGFCLFLSIFALLLPCAGLLLGVSQMHHLKALYLFHEEAVAASLLEQGVPGDVIARALTSREGGEAGRSLLAAAGIGSRADFRIPALLTGVWKRSLWELAAVCVLLFLFLAAGTACFFRQRKKLYQQADAVLTAYMDGDYSGHLPQNREGGIFQLFSSVERLAAMLQARQETERAAKVFMKSTISDISHQLKTPLAALAMYQEIMEEEPDNPETVRRFTDKMGVSLKRMEQLIRSMLKITRLDAGSILFEKNSCNVKELVADAVGELTVRAGKEGKEILLEGNPEQRLVCDREWTGEAIGNIVKNALDHTSPGDQIKISWEHTPVMLRISIADSGRGIAPEDIHHIFKRFYRSAHSLDSQGVGLGLPLAKSIVEGQGGILAVQSEPGRGAVFTISFPTEP